MALGICYQSAERLIITHFTDQQATLPIQTQQGIQFLPWGRKSQERGQLPLGGWLTLEAIKAGQWDVYFPKSCKIPALKFMEQDIEGKLRWFDVTPGQFIQGALLKEQDEMRLYIVTIQPQLHDALYPRWPRLVVSKATFRREP